jgi:hypothetical protein
VKRKTKMRVVGGVDVEEQDNGEASQLGVPRDTSKKCPGNVLQHRSAYVSEINEQ